MDTTTLNTDLINTGANVLEIRQHEGVLSVAALVTDVTMFDTCIQICKDFAALHSLTTAAQSYGGGTLKYAAS